MPRRIPACGAAVDNVGRSPNHWPAIVDLIRDSEDPDDVELRGVIAPQMHKDPVDVPRYGTRVMILMSRHHLVHLLAVEDRLEEAQTRYCPACGQKLPREDDDA